MSGMSQDSAITPTPHKEVNALLGFMLTRVRAILGDRMVGFYLGGSLSLGDFDPASSDVDFLIATQEELSEEILAQLRAMHREIAESGLRYAPSLEGSYIPLAALRRYDPANARHPKIDDYGRPLHIAQHSSVWVFERAIVREHGVVVWGAEPRLLIDPISPQDLRIAVCQALKTYWQPKLEGDLDWMRPRHEQGYVVLTFCRALYTLHKGELCPKPRAAAWAQEMYPNWQPIIERSLLWRSQDGIEDLTETLAFVREAMGVALKMCE